MNSAKRARLEFSRRVSLSYAMEYEEQCSSKSLPPQPIPAYGNTVIVSNPFDDTPTPKPLPQSKPMELEKVYPCEPSISCNNSHSRVLNAPPIYHCGACSREVRDNEKAIPCESGCNFWFHGICTGLTEAAYNFLTQEIYAEWVCNKCLNKKTVPPIKFKA